MEMVRTAEREVRHFFTITPKPILNLRHTKSEVLIWAMLTGLTKNGKRTVYASNINISEQVGCSRITVVRAMQRFEDEGLIEVSRVKRYSENGFYTQRSVTFTQKGRGVGEEGSDEMIRGGIKNDSNRDKNDTLNNNIYNNNNIKKNKVSVCDGNLENSLIPASEDKSSEKGDRGIEYVGNNDSPVVSTEGYYQYSAVQGREAPTPPSYPAAPPSPYSKGFSPVRVRAIGVGRVEMPALDEPLPEPLSVWIDWTYQGDFDKVRELKNCYVQGARDVLGSKLGDRVFFCKEIQSFMPVARFIFDVGGRLMTKQASPREIAYFLGTLVTRYYQNMARGECPFKGFALSEITNTTLTVVYEHYNSRGTELDLYKFCEDLVNTFDFDSIGSALASTRVEDTYKFKKEYVKKTYGNKKYAKKPAAKAQRYDAEPVAEVEPEEEIVDVRDMFSPEMREDVFFMDKIDKLLEQGLVDETYDFVEMWKCGKDKGETGYHFYKTGGWGEEDEAVCYENGKMYMFSPGWKERVVKARKAGVIFHGDKEYVARMENYYREYERLLSWGFVDKITHSEELWCAARAQGVSVESMLKDAHKNGRGFVRYGTLHFVLTSVTENKVPPEHFAWFYKIPLKQIRDFINADKNGLINPHQAYPIAQDKVAPQFSLENLEIAIQGAWWEHLPRHREIDLPTVAPKNPYDDPYAEERAAHYGQIFKGYKGLGSCYINNYDENGDEESVYDENGGDDYDENEGDGYVEEEEQRPLYRPGDYFFPDPALMGDTMENPFILGKSGCNKP